MLILAGEKSQVEPRGYRVYKTRYPQLTPTLTHTNTTVSPQSLPQSHTHTNIPSLSLSAIPSLSLSVSALPLLHQSRIPLLHQIAHPFFQKFSFPILLSNNLTRAELSRSPKAEEHFVSAQRFILFSLKLFDFTWN